MTHFQRILNIIQAVLNVFLWLTAIPGGICLLMGINTPPVEQLKGSIFHGFAIPGLSLIFVVGGSAVLATILLVRKSRLAVLSAGMAGVVVMFFEFIEVVSIGSPVGPARIMQILYFVVGGALVGISLFSRLSKPFTQRLLIKRQLS